jgi:hypothetical protein
VVAFLLSDSHLGRYHDQLIDLESAPGCEVVVRGRVAERVLETVRAGDAVLALGLLRVVVPVGVSNEADLVSLSMLLGT